MLPDCLAFVPMTVRKLGRVKRLQMQGYYHFQGSTLRFVHLRGASKTNVGQPEYIDFSTKKSQYQTITPVRIGSDSRVVNCLYSYLLQPISTNVKFTKSKRTMQTELRVSPKQRKISGQNLLFFSLFLEYRMIWANSQSILIADTPVSYCYRIPNVLFPLRFI